MERCWTCRVDGPVVIACVNLLLLTYIPSTQGPINLGTLTK